MVFSDNGEIFSIALKIMMILKQNKLFSGCLIIDTAGQSNRYEQQQW